MRSIVPAYVYPGDDARWAELFARTVGAESMFVINPASGPGPSRDPAWARRIDQILAAGHRPIGYVPVDYGRRAAETVDMIGTYARQYPNLAGIFLDEMPGSDIDPVAVDRLSAAILFARRMFSPTRNSMDALRVVANPGVLPSEQVVDALPRIGVWVVHEDRDRNGASTDDITPPRNPGWLEVRRQAFLSYNDPDVDATHARLAELGWQWGWSCSDPAPLGNPYDGDPAT